MQQISHLGLIKKNPRIYYHVSCDYILDEISTINILINIPSPKYQNQNTNKFILTLVTIHYTNIIFKTKHLNYTKKIAYIMVI
jgi:hypothetical protein